MDRIFCLLSLISCYVNIHLDVLKIGSNLNAGDENFLFEGSQNNNFFPNRRDVLAIEVGVPNENVSFTVMVMHTKARVGGRNTTEPRRVGSSIALVCHRAPAGSHRGWWSCRGH